MSDEFREDRFTADGGQTGTLSQCAYCKHNASIAACAAYVVKPEKYAMNQVKCPEREQIKLVAPPINR